MMLSTMTGIIRSINMSPKRSMGSAAIDTASEPFSANSHSIFCNVTSIAKIFLFDLASVKIDEMKKIGDKNG